MSTEFEQELRAGFLEEAKEMLANAERCFLSLESASGDPGTIEEIFRLAHSLKGSAGAVGFQELASFTHHLESFLLKIKKSEISITPEVVSLLLSCNDHLAIVLERLREDPSAPCDDPELSRRLTDAIEGKTAETAPALAPIRTGAPDSQAQHAPQVINNRDESIRVSLGKIDRLMNYVGELVILQTVMSEQRHQLASPLQYTTVTQMQKLIREIQEISMSLRMVPLKPAFQKLQRIVRDTSHALGKEVHLEIQGEETELDKTVLERISDPLVHLVRNAVDHGLEPTSDRIACGKLPAGQLRLMASQENGYIVIEIQDDGRGLDPKKLIAKATEKGLLRPEDNLTDAQAYQLIFAPGFSTKSEVTDISGRGVGLDVVKTNVQSLQGEIEVKTELGRGTRFCIRLPLSLAIVDGLVVRAGSERYVVPIAQVQQSLQTRSENISTVHGRGEVLKVRDEVLPHYRLEQLLGRSKTAGRPPPSQHTSLIVRDTRGNAFSIQVDEILHLQQVVIKRLGEEIKELPGVSGAAILGDGQAVLILDLEELLRDPTSRQRPNPSLKEAA